MGLIRKQYGPTKSLKNFRVGGEKLGTTGSPEHTHFLILGLNPEIIYHYFFRIFNLDIF